jgi:uncharacterized protein YndB with AHSA1/START domain
MARARVERRIDMPPGIVWAALVEPELVTGWLHPTATLLVDGEGVLVEEPWELVAETSEFGLVELRLAEVDGGSRGRSTDLAVTAGPEVDRRFLPGLRAGWEARLDRLEQLLRGEPADWDA